MPEVGTFSGMAGASLEMHLLLEGKAWAVNFEAGFIVAVGAAKEIGAAKLAYKFNSVVAINKPMLLFTAKHV